MVTTGHAGTVIPVQRPFALVLHLSLSLRRSPFAPRALPVLFTLFKRKRQAAPSPLETAGTGSTIFKISHVFISASRSFRSPCPPPLVFATIHPSQCRTTPRPPGTPVGHYGPHHQYVRWNLSFVGREITWIFLQSGRPSDGDMCGRTHTYQGCAR